MGHVIHVTLTIMVYCVVAAASRATRYSYKNPVLDCGYLQITPEEKYSWESPNFYQYRTIDPEDVRDPSIGVLKKEYSKNYISKRQSMDLSVLSDRMSVDTDSSGSLSEDLTLTHPTDNIAESSDFEPRAFEDAKFPEIQEHDHEKVITVVKNVAVPYPVEKEIRYPVIKKVPYPVHTPVAQPYPVEKEVPYPVKVVIKIPTKVPYPVPVYKEVPYAVQVPVERRIPYRTYIPEPYPVEKKVYYENKIPVPEPYPIEKTIPVPIKIPIAVPQPIPVEKTVAYPVEVKVDRPIPVPVPKPYPVPIYKHVPYPVYKPKPVPVEVNVKRPVPYEVVKHVPYPVEVKEPEFYPVEKEVPYSVEEHKSYSIPAPEEPAPIKEAIDEEESLFENGYKAEGCCGDDFKPSAVDNYETAYKYGERNDNDHEKLIHSDEVLEKKKEDVKPVYEVTKEDRQDGRGDKMAGADGVPGATDSKEVISKVNEKINEIDGNNKNSKKVKRLRKIIKRIKSYDSENGKEKGN
ncbi:extensin-like [Cotesia glomerata]|uniref:extensin-like n=1 Tax=Cotesia glomerata TaxID=32391 RepID=UPI001D01C071|nr:extensin-like [Cotesia glomerata]